MNGAPAGQAEWECLEPPVVWRVEGWSLAMAPSWRVTIRLAYSAMSGSWVTMMTVFPMAWRWSKRAMISSPVLESRFPVGSSARMMEGWLTRARAMATRWRWPPESSLGLCVMREPRLTDSSTDLARAMRSAEG